MDPDDPRSVTLPPRAVFSVRTGKLVRECPRVDVLEPDKEIVRAVVYEVTTPPDESGGFSSKRRQPGA